MAYQIEKLDAEFVDSAFELNRTFETELSKESAAEFESLIKCARVAWQVGSGNAFITAFRGGDIYDGVHFLWFTQNLPSFYYVDRVAVSPTLQGKGIARQFYQKLEAQARIENVAHICAEVNVEPPNPVSLNFHKVMGFRPLHIVRCCEKKVQYFVKDL